MSTQVNHHRIIKPNCPWCSGKLNPFIDEWYLASGYKDHFEQACPACGRNIIVDVMRTPEFLVTKRMEGEIDFRRSFYNFMETCASKEIRLTHLVLESVSFDRFLFELKDEISGFSRGPENKINAIEAELATVQGPIIILRGQIPHKTQTA